MDTPVVVVANRSDWLDGSARLSLSSIFNSKFFKAAPAAVPTGYSGRLKTFDCYYLGGSAE